MKMNKNIKLYQCLIVIFIMVIGLVSFGIAHNRVLEANEDLTAELNNSQVLLSTVENELNLTQNNLSLETEKSNKLSESLKAMRAELEIVNAELEVANTTIADLTSEEYELVYIGNFKLTHYCNEAYEHICGYGDGLTAIGTKVKPGRTIAVDPKVIPYGTEVYIEGYGWMIAEDCGGGVKGNHIDIAVNTHAEAMANGVKYSGVWILVKKDS